MTTTPQEFSQRASAQRRLAIASIANGKTPPARPSFTPNPGPPKASASAPALTPPAPPPVASQPRVGAFSNFGEFLLAVRDAGRDSAWSKVDPRLETRAASGASEAVPSDGGFLVPLEFSEAIIARVYSQGYLLSRFTYLPSAGGVNGVVVPAFDEQGRADGSRWGGVLGYWQNEATAAIATKPKYRNMAIKLNKLIASSYATDELLADVPALGAALMIAYGNELTFKVEYASLFGTGAGQPQGMLTAGNPALIVVPGESGQVAATITAINVEKMYSRMWGPSRSRAIWIVSQDVEPQLASFVQTLSTSGGSALPLFQYSETDDEPFNRLMGRPVIPSEYSAALGSQGDIAFIDPSQCVFSDKGGIDFANSMHVRFVNEEELFRMVWRVDSQPMWHAPLVPRNGTSSLSPYITLAARA